MKIATLLFIFTISFNQSFSQTKAFVCDGEISDYAKELIQEEFAGKRSGSDNACLKQEYFKYIRPLHDPINEITSAKSLTVLENSLRIEKIEKLDSAIGTYRATFTVVAMENGKNESKRSHRDSLVFLLDNDPKWGCAQLLTSPQALLLKSGCK